MDMEQQARKNMRSARKVLGRCICRDKADRPGPWQVQMYVKSGKCEGARGVCGLCGEQCEGQRHVFRDDCHLAGCSISSFFNIHPGTLTNTGVSG